MRAGKMSIRLLSLHVMLEWEILKNRTRSWEERMDVRWKRASYNSQACAEAKENGLELMSLPTFCCFPPWWYGCRTGETDVYNHHRAKHIAGPREAEGGFSEGWHGWSQAQIVCHTNKLRWKAALGMIYRSTWWLHPALPNKNQYGCCFTCAHRSRRNVSAATLTGIIQDRGSWEMWLILAQLIHYRAPAVPRVHLEVWWRLYIPFQNYVFNILNAWNEMQKITQRISYIKIVTWEIKFVI